MDLSDEELDFLQEHHGAAMITVGDEGVPKAVRVGIAIVDGEIWSSGRRDRVRTERLRRDPRCTLFVFDRAYAYLTLETTVTILEGPDVPERSVQLFRVMQGQAHRSAQLVRRGARRGRLPTDDDRRRTRDLSVRCAAGVRPPLRGPRSPPPAQTAGEDGSDGREGDHARVDRRHREGHAREHELPDRGVHR